MPVSYTHLDVYKRQVLKGGGTTFCVALGTVAIGTVFGVIIGAFTGYFGGILDEVLMRINDVDVYKRQDLKSGWL